MSRFVTVDRETAYLLLPLVNEWLPANHLARFVVEVIEQLGLLVYGYASGVHSSRKIERATCDSVAFRYVAANTHRAGRHQD